MDNTFEVNINEDIFKIELNTLDYINAPTSIIQTGFYVEEPTKVDSKTFQTTYSFVSNTLLVFLNGILETNITILTDTRFQFPEEVLNQDKVIVAYMKKEG